jgi:hypothetical protein
MQQQWCRVTRGFWHAGKAWGEGETLAVDRNTANLLRGNRNVEFIDAPAPAPAPAPAADEAPAKPRRGGVA